MVVMQCLRIKAWHTAGAAMNKRQLTIEQLKQLRAGWAVSPLPDPEQLPSPLWLVTGSSVTVTDRKPKQTAGLTVERLLIRKG